MEAKSFNTKYKIERKIAQGGMSSIYLCTNLELGNKWIAKHIDRRYESFFYEEEILKKLNHISLPKIIDIYRDETGLYIIESYIEGISLGKKLDIFSRLRIDSVIDYSLQLCEVLQYLHNMKPKAIIHKDLKPTNIIITEDDKVVLIDFGIAEEQGASSMKLIAATNAYAPPEQLVSTSSCDTRGDIYSLGIVIYQMLTGSLPLAYDIDNNRSHSFVHRRLLEISQKCTCFLPENRFQRIEEIRQELLLLREKQILIKEKKRIIRKLMLIIIALISLINYSCFLIGLYL